MITFRGVTKSAFWSTLNDRLGPMLTQPSAVDALAAFESHFEGVDMKKGTELRLALSRDSTVSTLVGGERVRACFCV